MVVKFPCMVVKLLIGSIYLIIGIGYLKCKFHHLMIQLCEMHQ